MAAVDIAILWICAFCPNPCRSEIPASLGRQIESQTPSALALLALHAVEGRVPSEPSVREVLLDLEAAVHCQPACVYDFDIPSMVRAVAESLPR